MVIAMLMHHRYVRFRKCYDLSNVAPLVWMVFTVFFVRNCSYEIAEIITHILNLSFSSAVVPSSAVVTPVPKVPKPTYIFFSFKAYLFNTTSLYVC